MDEKVLDLFSGIGGKSMAFHRHGFKTIGFAEIEKYQGLVLEKRFPGIPNLKDVTTLCRRTGENKPEDEDGFVECSIHPGQDFGECDCIGTDQFIDEYGQPDVIIGGDPCQENSNSNRNAAALHKSLGHEYIRIIRELQPGFVLRENSGVVKGDAPWPWQRFSLCLEQIGYYTLPIRTRACCFGADHRRERMFVLAALQDAHIQGLERAEREIMAGTIYRRYHSDIARPDRRHTAPRICRGADGIPKRVDRLKALGNSVYPPQIEFLAWIIRNIIDGKI